jgi:hypothetical protein
MRMIIRSIDGAEFETTLEEFVVNSMGGAYYTGHADGLLGKPSRKPYPPEGVFSIDDGVVLQDKTAGPAQ